MRVAMLIFCLSSLLFWSSTLADLDGQISLTDAVKMIRDLQEANAEFRRDIGEVRRENAEVKKENEAMISKMSELQETNAEVQREIGEVKKENEAMKSKMSELQETNAEVQREIGEVKKENEAMKSKVAELQEANDEVREDNVEAQKEIAEIQTANEAMKSKMSQLVNVVSHVEMDLVDLQTNVTTFSHQISVLNDRESGHVGFSVAAEQIEEYNEGDAIKYPHVNSDFKPSSTSGGWDPSSNRYTCPVSGHYMFLFTLFEASGAQYGNFAADLTHTSGSEDRIVTRVHNIGGDDVRLSSTSHAIVHCAAGDQVWMRVYFDDSTLYDAFVHHNNFLGFLIKPGL